jgi:hypothetical protein
MVMLKIVKKILLIFLACTVHVEWPWVFAWPSLRWRVVHLTLVWICKTVGGGCVLQGDVSYRTATPSGSSCGTPTSRSFSASRNPTLTTTQLATSQCSWEQLLSCIAEWETWESVRWVEKCTLPASCNCSLHIQNVSNVNVQTLCEYSGIVTEPDISRERRVNKVIPVIVNFYEGVSKFSGLAAWNENCKWYSSLPLGAVVSLFCESV